jgi:hypothetical protein
MDVKDHLPLAEMRRLERVEKDAEAASDHDPWPGGLDGAGRSDCGRPDPPHLSAVGASRQRRRLGGTRRSARPRSAAPAHAPAALDDRRLPDTFLPSRGSFCLSGAWSPYSNLLEGASA